MRNHPRRSLGTGLATLALALVVPGLVVTPGADATRDCEAQLLETVARFDEAFFARDLDGFVGFMHKEATGILQDGTVFLTTAEARAFYEQLFALPGWTTEFTPLKRVVHRCTTAQIIQNATFDIPDRGVHLEFVNVLTWVKERGHWQLLSDQSTALPAE